MRTIYEKEALFENLDAAFAELKEYILSAVAIRIWRIDCSKICTATVWSIDSTR